MGGVVALGAGAACVLALAMAVWAKAPAQGTSFGYAVVRGSCAPWDGPAVAVTLTEQRASCKQAVYPQLQIAVWRGFPIVAPATIEFNDKADNGGAAVLCTAENACQRAVSGEVKFDSYNDGKSAKGSYEFTFRDGTTMKGTFDAEWCQEKIMCG
jgi:hypothetical protein